MMSKLMKKLWLVVPVVGVIAFVGCQPKGSGASESQASAENDSIKIEKRHFNNNPKQPVEWEVTRKKAPDGTYFRHGESRRYTASGKLAEKLNYVNNKKEGQRLFYYTEGKVWKEQNYKNNLLDGECKKFFRDGKVEAEYSYLAGNPGVGLKEYFNSGKQKPSPSLVVTQTDEIKATGYHRLTANLSGDGMDRIKKVEFYEGALVDGKFADIKKLTPFKQLSATKGEMLLSVPKGTFINSDLNIVAIATTKTGLKLVLTTRVHVAVRGA